MWLTRLAIARPVFMLMLMLAAILLGVISWRSMRIEQNPNIDFGIITVQTQYPGAGPEEINELITKKIEDAISGVSGIREVMSTSLEGVSVVTVQFELDTPIDRALSDVRTKVDQIANDLPLNSKKPTITKVDTTSQPVLFLVLESPNYNSQQLRALIDNIISDRFARIRGVSQVSVSGGGVREIQVQVKREKLLKYTFDILDIVNAVQGATINQPSGHLIDGNREYTVRVFGEFQNVDQIRNMMLSKFNPVKFVSRPIPVRLSDIADVHDTIAEVRSKARLNGNDAILITIRKSNDGNSINIARDAESVIKEIKQDYNVNTVKTYEEAIHVREGLADLNFAIAFGIFLVTLTVYVFLHNLRGTLIVAIAIPVTIFASFILMKLVGFTINNLSMLALSLSIGVLVDDAIVVLENIYRHLKLGESPVTAAINGRSEIGLAAIAITLADVVVFLPIGFMGGLVGEFFRPLGIVYVFVVILSLLVSFTITPMLAARWYRSGENVEDAKGRFARTFESGFNRFEKFYERVLEWALVHRWFVVITGFAALIGVFALLVGGFAGTLSRAIALGLLAGLSCVFLGFIVWLINLLRGYGKLRFILYGGCYGIGFLLFTLLGFAFASWKGEPIFKFAFLPPNETGSIAINIQLPPGASLDATDRVVKQVEHAIYRDPNIKYVLSTVGAEGVGVFQATDIGTYFANITVVLYTKKSLLDSLFPFLVTEKLRTKSDEIVAGDLISRIGRIPGAFVAVAPILGYSTLGSLIQVSFKSDNRELLSKTVLDIRDRLKDGVIQGVINPDTSTKPDMPEIRAIPNRARLADHGITTVNLANAMYALYQGDNNTKFREKGWEYDIRVMMNLEERDDPTSVGLVPAFFLQGEPIYLNTVTDIEKSTSLNKIERRDRMDEIRITADLLPGYAAGTVQAELSNWLINNKLLPPGVTFKPLGQADLQVRESGYLFGALSLGLVLVYMLLASLYNNLLYPFIIQLAQPQAMVGALLALMITDKTFNIVGFIGIVTLVGLVGKNAILLVDYTNTLRDRGYSRHDALLQAGPTRLRPIMMTTLALIFGLLPIALALGRGSEFRETLGIVIIGGMTLSTLLTLVVIPCSYTIVDDISVSVTRFLHRLMGHGDEVAT